VITQFTYWTTAVLLSQLSANILWSFSHNIRYLVNVWVMDYIHHNSSMVWSPFNNILAPLQLKAVSCSKGICGPFNLLSVYKAQVWRSDADKWKTQRIVCRVCTTCWLNRITQKHCLMLVLWEGILVHMPTNRLHNLFHICSLFPLSLGKTCLWENKESQVLDYHFRCWWCHSDPNLWNIPGSHMPDF